jgi:hypothetical protein
MAWANNKSGVTLSLNGENTCNEAEKYLNGEKRGRGCFAGRIY